jgi:hypothetical protein
MSNNNMAKYGSQKLKRNLFSDPFVIAHFSFNGYVFGAGVIFCGNEHLLARVSAYQYGGRSLRFNFYVESVA